MLRLYHFTLKNIYPYDIFDNILFWITKRIYIVDIIIKLCKNLDNAELIYFILKYASNMHILMQSD